MRLALDTLTAQPNTFLEDRTCTVSVFFNVSLLTSSIRCLPLTSLSLISTLPDGSLQTHPTLSNELASTYMRKATTSNPLIWYLRSTSLRRVASTYQRQSVVRQTQRAERHTTPHQWPRWRTCNITKDFNMSQNDIADDTPPPGARCRPTRRRAKKVSRGQTNTVPV
jgi:hypothetical protein